MTIGTLPDLPRHALLIQDYPSRSLADPSPPSQAMKRQAITETLLTCQATSSHISPILTSADTHLSRPANPVQAYPHCSPPNTVTFQPSLACRSGPFLSSPSRPCLALPALPDRSLPILSGPKRATPFSDNPQRCHAKPSLPGLTVPSQSWHPSTHLPCRTTHCHAYSVPSLPNRTCLT